MVPPSRWVFQGELAWEMGEDRVGILLENVAILF